MQSLLINTFHICRSGKNNLEAILSSDQRFWVCWGGLEPWVVQFPITQYIIEDACFPRVVLGQHAQPLKTCVTLYVVFPT